MRRLKLAALAVLALFASNLTAHAEECSNLSVCVQTMRMMAQANGPHSGVGAVEARLKQQILRHQGAVDVLIPLLKDPDKRVADLAAFVLRDAPTIDPIYLPRIRDGLDRNLGWLAPALARIDTDEAAKEAVDRYLVSDSAPDNQEAYAVELSGGRAIPFMLERASCQTPCRDDTHRLLGAVLGRMGRERAAAGPELLRLASDREVSPQVARGALRMIASLGADGLPLEAGLLREREASPHLAALIENALIGIGSMRAGAIFAERLAGRPDLVTLRDLAETGIAGRDAGPVVIEILEQEPSLRAPAATTLGFIGYAGAAPALIAMLEESADVRAAWVAARALGRLLSQDALPALDRVAEQHWYAPVRDAAREAAQRIRSGPVDADPARDNNFINDFFAFQWINRGLDKCPADYEFKRESTETKLHVGTADEKLKRLAYITEVVTFDAADAEEQKQAGAKIIRAHAGNLVEHRQPIEQVPHVALRVDDGWLVGGSRGEWGGELGFLGDDGRFQRILGDNVEDIHRLGGRIVATIGLAHLSSNEGAVMDLTRSTDGRWHASTWRVLPGAPGTSVVVEQDGLVVAVTGGGAVGIEADGGMRMAACPR